MTAAVDHAPLLAVDAIRATYDRVDVLHGVSLTVAPGSITCILGANGAGKSTLIRAILGLTPPHTGEIRFDGQVISGLPTHRIIGQGIAKRCEAFGLTIAYHGRSQQKGVPYRYYANLTEMARDVDILISVAPGGPDTFHIIDAQVLRALGPQGILINIGRGSVVDEPALIRALKDRTIASAGLDVFENEPKVPKNCWRWITSSCFLT